MRSLGYRITHRWNRAFTSRGDTGLWLRRLSRETAELLLLLAALSCVALAQLPGEPAPIGNPPTDGSVLIYNYYSSNIPFSDEDTVFEMTNNHASIDTFVHVVFLDGNTCSAADTVFCLGPSQTISFLASELDPQNQGYIVAIAKDIDGLPIKFNFLSGHEEIHLDSGHQGDFDAVAIEAIANPPTDATNQDITTTLNFDGISYSKVPRVLELEPVYSVEDKTSTLLIVNRVSVDLTQPVALGFVHGIFTNLDTGTQLTFDGGSPGCQLSGILSDIFPVMTPVFSQALPKKQEGNLKIWATADFGVSGAALSLLKKGKKLDNGGNLRAVTVTTDSLVTILFPPTC